MQYANGQLSQSLWNVTSSQGPSWKFSTINIGAALGLLASGWKIQYSSEPNTNSFSFSYFNDEIALDDISFVNCNPNDHLKPLKCDFETDFCGWSNDLVNTQFNWTRYKGSTDSDETGPPGDQYCFI